MIKYSLADSRTEEFPVGAADGRPRNDNSNGRPMAAPTQVSRREVLQTVSFAVVTMNRKKSADVIVPKKNFREGLNGLVLYTKDILLEVDMQSNRNVYDVKCRKS